MTEEEMQKKMGFIIEQQAQFASHQLEIQERPALHDIRLN